MRYESIADIYSANEKISGRLADTVSGLSEGQANALPEGEKWSIQQIVEHISIVDQSVFRICTKLLDAARAADVPSNGTFTISEDLSAKFGEIGELKVEAPERVHPTGNVPIAESLDRIKASGELINRLRGDMESLELSTHKFPHPFFGDLTAAEWLVVMGGHGARHNAQIERILERIAAE